MVNSNIPYGLSRDHIRFILGIKIPLNESVTVSEHTRALILEEQLLYETFLDTIKDYAKEKYDQAVTTIKDWKDAAVVLGKVLSNSTFLNNFSNNYWKTFKSNTLKKITDLLNKLGLPSLVTSVNNLVDKVTSLEGWKKFLAATAIGSISQYIVSKIKDLPKEEILNLIKDYFSEKVLKDIVSKLTDFKSYIGWLQPIIGTVNFFYESLKPTIQKFQFAFGMTNSLKNKVQEESLKLLDILKNQVLIKNKN